MLITESRSFKIKFGWFEILQRLMYALMIVKVKIFFQSIIKLNSIFKCMKINTLIHDTASKPLDKNIINRSAFSIHGYFYAGIFQQCDVFIGSKLTSLVGVHDQRLAVHPDGFLSYSPNPLSCHCV